MTDCIQIFIQKNLIPVDALSIRTAMDEAMMHGISCQACEAHFLATLYAVKAVALSFFTIFVYTVRAMASLVVDLTNGEIIRGLEDLGADLLNAARLSLFSALGVVYIGIGFFLPETVYPYFLPEIVLPPEVTGYDEVIAQNRKLRTNVAALENREALIGVLNDHRQRQLNLQLELAELQASHSTLSKDKISLESQINELSEKLAQATKRGEELKKNLELTHSQDGESLRKGHRRSLSWNSNKAVNRLI
jgi:hypothetical protein